MRAELFAPAGFVASFDMPPFKVPPGAVQWGSRTFARAGEVVHLSNCSFLNQVTASQPPMPAHCNCDGAYAYDEVTVWHLADMHQIEAARAAPITRKP